MERVFAEKPGWVPGSPPPARPNALRRCACGGTPGPDGECAACRQKRLQRQAAAGPGVAPPIVHDVLRSPGEPLDAAARGVMEPRFGHSFANVRVHTDARAAESARAVEAAAYTVGRRIVFGAGAYAPASAAGRRLLAHELTHVVQQGAASAAPNGSLEIGPAGDGAEREAERMSAGAGGRESLPGSRPGGLYRQRLQRQGPAAPAAPAAGGRTVYLCSKDLDTSPMGKHAFFRIGGSGKGNPTLSLQPVDSSLGANCWQGMPGRDYPSDYNAEATCDATSLTEACLETQYSAYPIGHYCTLGPNSNTFVGHLARACGMANPDPTGWTPGIGDSPPPRGTYAPDKWETLTGCTQKKCIINGGEPRPGPVGTPPEAEI